MSDDAVKPRRPRKNNAPRTADVERDGSTGVVFSPFLGTSDPAPGTTKVVRPIATSALANACVTITFADPMVVVYAKVYVDVDATIPSSPPPSATLGQSADSKVWTWNDNGNNPANPLPGVNFTAAATFPINWLVWWYKASPTDAYQIDSSTFRGKKGNPGVACGG